MRNVARHILCLAAGLALGYLAASVVSAPAPLTVRPAVTGAATAKPEIPFAARSDAAVPKPSTARIIERFLSANTADTVKFIGACGALAGLDDSDARQAWDLLLRRAHTNSPQEKQLALYLWSRLVRLDPTLRLPELWSRDMNPEALLAERVRLSMDSLRERLLAGESVDAYERKAFFQELAARDPAAGLDFWLRVSNHLEHIGELSAFAALLRDPATRAGTLAKVSAAAGRDSAELIAALAAPWVVADLHESGAWIKTVADPDLKQRLSSLLLSTSASALPATVFEVTESLPVAERTGARATGIAQLAYEDPVSGMLLLEKVSDPSERRELIRVFGNNLAMHDTEAWLAWRETLPSAEHDHANSAAFSSWAVHQPSQAASWLQSQPAGQERDQLAAELVRISAVNNTDTAIAWINQISNPRDRLMAISMALGNLAPGDTQRMETILRASLPPKAPGG